MVFQWSLSDSKSPQVSRTLHSILAVLNNAVVWMVSTRSPTSKSSSPFSNPLVTVPNAPITIGIIVTYMFHSFFSIPYVFIPLFTFFQFYSVVSRDSKVDNFSSSLFLLVIIKSGLLAGIRWSVCKLKPHIIIIIIIIIRVFHISFSWWFCTEIWVIASLLKSPGLSILAIFNNAVVWMIFPCSLISKPSSSYNNPLETIIKSPITIGIIITYMFPIFFFNSQARSRYLSFFSLSLKSIIW